MNNSTIDKYGIILPKGSFKRVTNVYNPNPHIKVYWEHGQLHLTATSKVVVIPDTLNHITIDDINKHSEIILNSTGYDIPFEVIMTSPLFWLDMKTDVENTTGFNNKAVYSVLREKAYQKTTRHETPSFDKKHGFENSLLITSSSKTVNDSLEIYNKVDEIKASCWLYPEYYNNFSEEFLRQNANILRFERRLQKAKDIKKAFHLEEQKNVTLSDIFNSNVDVVAEKVRKLFM